MHTTAAVILAAGASRRFGGAKLLAEIDGEPMVRRTARAFLDAGTARTVVVLGARAKEVEAALSGLGVETVVNQDWESGEMFSSVRAGLAAAAGPYDWVLVSPADIPGLSAAVISRFVQQLPAPDGLMAAVPSTGSRRGHPLALSLPAARAVSSWVGQEARLDRVFSDRAFVALHITGFGPEVLHDVDRPEDFDQRRGET